MAAKIRQGIVGGVVIAGLVAGLATTSGCRRSDEGDNRSAEAGGVVDRPPAPDCVQRVDYVAWYSARHFQGDWPCGRDVYPFMFDEDVESALRAEEELADALNAASKSPWASSELPGLAEYLRELRPYLEAYTHGATSDNVRWFCGADTWWPEPHPDYTKFSRVLGKALLAAAWMDAPPADHGAASLLEALATNFRHAGHLRHAGGLTAFFANSIIRHMNYEAIRRALSTQLLSGKDAAAVLELLHSEDEPRGIAETYRCEWLSLLDLLQQLHPGGEFSNRVAKELKQNEYLPAGGMMLRSPKRTATGIDNWFRPFVEAAERPWSVETYRQVDQLARKRADKAGGDLFLNINLPSLGRTYLFGMTIETERRGTIVIAALHAYRYEHDRWPTSLDQLETLSPTMRVDPFSGRAFGYELRDDRPWLYSVGLDGVDDGGNHDPRAAGSDRKKGHDLVLFPVPAGS